MYISCPSCSTSFSVSGSDIGTSGQAVRCFKCSHIWHQYPIPPQAQAQYVPVQYVSPGQFSVSPELGNVPPPQQQYTPPPEIADFKSSTSHEPVSDPVPEPSPEKNSAEPIQEPEPLRDDVKESSPPATEPEPTEEATPSDEELDAMLGPVDEEAVSSILEENDIDQADDISMDELENMEDPEPIAAISSEEPSDDDESDIEPEDIPDPEPIAMSSFDSEPEEEEKKGGGLIKIIIWLLIIFVIIGGVGAGAVYKRKMVVKLLPVSNIVFEMIGLGVLIPGQGLRIKSDDPIRVERDGKKVTVIKGVVTNISSTVQQVPEILLQAVDSKDRIVLTQKVIPEKLKLAPGKFVKFTGEFKKLPKTAKRLDITYGSFIADNTPKTGGPKDASSTNEKTKKAVQSDPIKPTD